ncbi:MAG: hypothetical protein LBL61_06650 [Elusimicrobiota bacterium]|jgi:ADP-heptose:LPS heptosyltransferase|nr:hypothetical protein [Elusimicrobiota bacterium]
MKKFLLKIFANKKIRKEFDIKKVKSALIRPIGTGIGDAVVLTAVFAKLKIALPNVKTGVFATKRNEYIFKNNKYIDSVIKITPFAYLRNRKKWDVFIDFVPTFTTKNIVLDYILAPAFTLCFDKTTKKHYRKDTVKNYDIYCSSNMKKHLSDFLSLTPFKNYTDNIPSFYTLPEPEYTAPEKAETLWMPEKIRILFSPAGSGKRISDEDISAIAKKLAYPAKLQGLLTNTSDSRFYASLQNIPALPVRLSPVLNLGDLMALVKSADLIISVDTAVVHIACALRKPVIGIYPNYSQSFIMFSPLNNANALMIIAKTPVHDNAGILKGVPVEEVAEAAKQIIDLILMNKPVL